MRIDRLDHLVLTVADIEETCRFYTEVLGMRREEFGAGRVALKFGDQKINLHPASAPLEPHARIPTPGSADLCFLTKTPIAQVMARLWDFGVTILEGPVERSGARSRLNSVYCTDPDGNLIEISNSF
ncbi:MAG: VOC family protein [Rhodospirillales bacterium]|nr:VOC family protein [Rhodospirillales bacterium]